MKTFNSFSELAAANSGFATPRFSTKTENGVFESVIDKYRLNLFEHTDKGVVLTRGIKFPNLVQKIKQIVEKDGVPLKPFDERDKAAIIKLYDDLIRSYGSSLSKAQKEDIESYKQEVAGMSAQQLLALGFDVTDATGNPTGEESYPLQDKKPGDIILDPTVRAVSPSYIALQKEAAEQQKTADDLERQIKKAQESTKAATELLPTLGAQQLAQDPDRMRRMQSDLYRLEKQTDEAADQLFMYRNQTERLTKTAATMPEYMDKYDREYFEIAAKDAQQRAEYAQKELERLSAQHEKLRQTLIEAKQFVE
jgi:hypothetical protein